MSATDELVKAQNLARTIGRDFENDDVTPELSVAAEEFAKTYKGTNTFIPKVRGKRMTPGRARAVLNVMRQEALGIDPPWKRKGKTSAAPAAASKPAPAAKQACFNCDEEFATWKELFDHKKSCKVKKGAKPASSTAASAPKPHGRYYCYNCKIDFKSWEDLTDHRHVKHGGRPRKGTPVIPIRDSELDLDLSGLPDGNYAIANPDKTSSHSFIYIKVKRQRRRTYRDRLFTWGHKTRGGEWVEPGTIEVREYSSDSKRLFGEQKLGDVYRGEHEELLEEIMKLPVFYAKQFGIQMSKCGICGKRLTDDESKALGIGPECAKKDHYWTEKPKSYAVRTVCGDCKEGGKIIYLHQSKRDSNVSYECKNGHEWEVEVTNERLKTLTDA